MLAGKMMRLAPNTDVSTAKTKSLRELKKTLEQAASGKSLREEAYIDKAKYVESRQVKLFLGFLDRDIAMTFKNAVRPYLRAVYQHEDLISRCESRGKLS
jgi:hypothetical protein